MIRTNHQLEYLHDALDISYRNEGMTLYVLHDSDADFGFPSTIGSLPVL